MKIFKREPRFGTSVADPYDTVEGNGGIGIDGNILAPRIKVQDI